MRSLSSCPVRQFDGVFACSHFPGPFSGTGFNLLAWREMRMSTMRSTILGIAPYVASGYAVLTLAAGALNSRVARGLVRSGQGELAEISSPRTWWRFVRHIMAGGSVGSSDRDLARWSKRARIACWAWLCYFVALLVLMGLAS